MAAFFSLFSAVFPISSWLFSGLFGYFYHVFYIHFAAPPWFLFLSALSFVCPVSNIFFPFSLSSFLAANVLIQTVICIAIPIFSADCWLYKKQSRSRKCQSSCAWVSLWRERENPPPHCALGLPPAVLPSTGVGVHLHLSPCCGQLIN